MRAKTQKKPQRWCDPEQFRLARCRAGLTVEAAAERLDVTTQTLRNWEHGRTAIPYAPFKVMRLLGGFLLAGEAWEGWIFWKGKLFSPEGRSFEPHELRYISNYFTTARLFLKQRDTLQQQTVTQAKVTADAASGSSSTSSGGLRFWLLPCGAAPRQSGNVVPFRPRLQEKASGADTLGGDGHLVSEVEAL